MNTDTSAARFTFPATVTLRNIEAARSALADYFGGRSAVEIDCSAVVEADLSLIQLVLAARNSARRFGKTLILTQPLSEVLRDSLARGGFLNSAADQEFWLKKASTE